MQPATIEKTKHAAKPFSRLIDLGNGVMFPVNSEEEASFVEWMIEEAKAGRASLPKRAPQPMERPEWFDTEPKMTTEEFEAFYEEERADRF
ncbi:hypothetical protein R83H12_02352 [Fibrobacteria bacterium R8-3-H12]